eukprot:15334148-Ditylum_brightwellii.AAC.2
MKAYRSTASFFWLVMVIFSNSFATLPTAVGSVPSQMQFWCPAAIVAVVGVIPAVGVAVVVAIALVSISVGVALAAVLVAVFCGMVPLD